MTQKIRPEPGKKRQECGAQHRVGVKQKTLSVVSYWGKKESFRKNNTGCEKPRSAQKQNWVCAGKKGGVEWKLGAGIDVTGV